MDFAKYIRILSRHRFALMIIPVLVMIITFFLVRKSPDVYSSQSRLSAGLTAGSQSMQLAQQLLSGSDANADSKINQTFSNVTQTMQLKIVYDQVSYLLMIHDLTNEKPFRKSSKLVRDLNVNARRHAVEVYTRLYDNRQSLYLVDDDQNGLNEVLISMGYNYEALHDKVKIFRVENSDFIDVDYEADNPLLSEFVVNNLCNEFIKYYSTLTQQNKMRSVDFLHDLLVKKKDSLDAKVERLKDYKIKNRILNITDEAKTLYSQIADFETKRQYAEKEVEANDGAIKHIDAKFTGNEKQYMEGRLALINKEIVTTQDQLNILNDQYINSNFDNEIKTRIDSLKKVLAQKINQSTDKYIVNPLIAKENLLIQKLKLETDRALAESSINSFNVGIERLNKKLETLAPSQATIQTAENDIAETGKEYLEILTRYNVSAMQMSTQNPIKVIEPALPGKKQPSKKLMLVALSGIVSVVVYLFILFVLFYIDDSIRDSADLASKTDGHVLGSIPMTAAPLPDIKKILVPALPSYQHNGGTNGSAAETDIKRIFRSLRFEVNEALEGRNNLVVTSLMEKEGKTVISLNLVRAFQMMNKKTLLIDGNFLSPDITRLVQPQFFIEDYLSGRIGIDDLARNGATVIGNRGSELSLFEINSQKDTAQKLEALRQYYEVVIIESPALDSQNQAKEWITVADAVLALFEANTSIRGAKKDDVRYLSGLDEKFCGWIINKVTV